MLVNIQLGDCLNQMRILDKASIDSIVTDPPYGLSFMGKGWDHGVPGAEFWAEALRVAKPGAHLLAFGGTRTYHRLACAIEDAGWEIRDCVMWVYGSGFPKSLNVSTAISKLAEPNAEPNAEEVEFCDWLRANSTREHVCSTLGKRFWDCEVQIVNTATKERPILGRRALFPTAARWRLFKAGHSEEIPVRIEQLAKPEPSRAETPGEEWTPGKGNGSVGCGQWSGWGTALKPAWEPIIVARKPLVGTVAENVLAHGTGGINVDGCRVGTEDNLNGWAYSPSVDGMSQNDVFGRYYKQPGKYIQPQGRWPANLIHDGSDEVVGLFPVTWPAKKADRGKGIDGLTFQNANGSLNGIRGHNDNGGSAARFFYCAKASKADRDADNKHPTVKPTALMRYLCRLVTPPGGTVLDPFCGSGSTGKAAIIEGFRFIGIEREAEYVKIAKARVASAIEKRQSVGIGGQCFSGLPIGNGDSSNIVSSLGDSCDAEPECGTRSNLHNNKLNKAICTTSDVQRDLFEGLE